MKFDDLVSIVAGEPLFETGLLLAGDVDPRDVRRQLSRWTRSSKIVQVRRGLYALCPPYRRSEPHSFLVANRLVRGSYVSCESALSFHGLVPDVPSVVTSVTLRRPWRCDGPLGRFAFRHIRDHLLCGFESYTLTAGQSAWVATPEKALLDLVHLTPGGERAACLEELRLQNTDVLDPGRLLELARKSGRPKLMRASRRINEIAARAEMNWRTA